MKVNNTMLRATFAVLLAIAGVSLLTTGVTAQERSHDRILFLVPVPQQAEDSMWVHEMTDRLRDRAQNKFRHKWQVVQKDVITELLINSGFDSLTIVGSEMAEQFARPLQAHAYVYGEIQRNGATPVGKFRMVDVSRSGLSGWMTVMGQPGDPARSFADRVADSLENQVRAADKAKECNMRRDRSEWRRAREAAEDAFELYPNHPSTAQCMSYVFQGQQAPNDSLIWIYEKQTRGDSLNMRAWENLSRAYTRAGDTAAAVIALDMRLAANPSDSTLRLQLAAGHGVSGEFDKALEVLDEGLEMYPGNRRFLRMKAQTCEQAEMWGCVLETQTELYDVDTTLVGQTSFYNGQFMLATQESDTTAMLRWATLYLEYEPESMQFLQARALLLTQLGHTDSALAVHEQIHAVDPTNLQSAIAVVQAQIEAFTVDSTQPLDTDGLAAIQAGLDNLENLGADNPNITTMVGGEYLKIAQKFGSAQTDWNRVIQYAEAALERDPNGVLDAAANFWLGYGVFSITVPMDAQIMQAQTCSPLIDTYERNLTRARTALEAGRSVSEEAAGQLLDYLNQLSERPAQFRASFCGR